MGRKSSFVWNLEFFYAIFCLLFCFGDCTVVQQCLTLHHINLVLYIIYVCMHDKGAKNLQTWFRIKRITFGVVDECIFAMSVNHQLIHFFIHKNIDKVHNKNQKKNEFFFTFENQAEKITIKIHFYMIGYFKSKFILFYGQSLCKSWKRKKHVCINKYMKLQV